MSNKLTISQLEAHAIFQFASNDPTPSLDGYAKMYPDDREFMLLLPDFKSFGELIIRDINTNAEYLLHPGCCRREVTLITGK